MSKVLEKLIRYMVKQSREGIFYGSPRKKMEKIGVSSGPLYQALKDKGFIRFGKGKSAKWKISQSIIDQYK